ncbi:excisionase [Agathobaculum sp.]
MTETKECERFVLWVGTRRLIKRKAFEAYLQNEFSI